MSVDQAGLHLDNAPWPGATVARRWYLKSALAIGPDRIVLLGVFSGLADGDHVILEAPNDTRTVRAHLHELPQGTIAVVPVEHAPSVRSLHMRSTTTVTDGVSVPRVEGDIGVLLRSGVATLPEHERLSLLAFLTRACGADREVLPTRLVTELQTARHALREPRPEAIIDPEGRRAAKVEVLARIDAGSYYMRGWIGRGDDTLAGVSVVSPEGTAIDLTTRLTRFGRDDVAQFYGEEEDDTATGFAVHFTSDVPSRTDSVGCSSCPIGEPPTDAPAPPVTNGHAGAICSSPTSPSNHCPR
jgi:hypothetical protein